MNLFFIGKLIELIIAIFVGVFFGMAYFSKKFRKKFTFLTDKNKLWYLFGLVIGILASIIRLLSLFN